MNRIFCIVWLSLVWVNVNMAQQVDEYRFNFDNYFLRNPAALSVWNQSEAGVFYQKAFTAVTNAPVNMFAAGQFGIPNQAASVGIGLMNESAGVLRNTSISISSSYKLLNILRTGDFLAGGLNISFNQIGVNGALIEANDITDPLVSTNLETGISANVGFGVYYSSIRVMEKRRPSTNFQAGLAMVKALPTNINLESVSFRERYMLNSLLRIQSSLNENFSIYGQADFQYEGKGLLNAIFSAKALLANIVIIGGSYDTFNTLGFMGGVRLEDMLGSDTETDIFFQANIPMGTIDNFINTGYGIGIQYRYLGNQFTRF